jgi:hypothetical protein
MADDTLAGVGCGRHRTRAGWPALAVAGMLATGAAAAALGPDDFVIDDAATLVDLCAAPTDDPYDTQAIHRCHGYASGVVQYALLLFAGAGAEMICLPEPQPTRSEAVADFVAWLDGQPELADVKAPEALLRFMQVRFPCR